MVVLRFDVLFAVVLVLVVVFDSYSYIFDLARLPAACQNTTSSLKTMQMPMGTYKAITQAVHMIMFAAF